MRLILKYVKNYKFLVFLNIVALIAFSVTELGIPTLMGWMIDEGVATQDFALVQRYSVMLLAIALLGSLGSVLLSYTSTRIATRITRDIRVDLFAKSQELGHAEYNKFGVSSMITRISGDVYQLQLFVQMLLRNGLWGPIMMIACWFFIFNTSTRLAGIMAISIPLVIFVIFIVGRKSEPISRQQQKLMDALNRVTRENITGVRVIRAFRKDKYENQRFEAVNEDYAQTSKKLFRLMATAEPFFFLILNLFVIIISWVAALMISDGTLQVGSLVAFMEYQFLALFSLLMFSVVFIMYPRASVSARRIVEILEEIPDIQNPEHGIKKLDQPVQSVTFEHVDFGYPDGQALVLKDISFTAKQGETVAFIGSTGSGKSTLVKLMERFYDVSSGRILIDHDDIRDYDVYALRSKIGFVSQKALLFSGSIADNIRYGKQDANQGEIVESANLAAAQSFIEAKEHQYNEWLSEGGTNVSGGQKQRLSIARALVRKPAIYIFDDSFSALDYKTDAMIRKNLKSETKDSITFIVAQRISSIMDANKIIVLNEGEIVGEGTHQELMQTCPIYVEIARSQFSEKEMEAYE